MANSITNFYEKTDQIFTVTISTGVDITSDTVTLYIKKNINDVNTSAVITSVADVATSGATGVAIFTLTDVNTTVTPGSYFYDIIWLKADTTIHVSESASVLIYNRIDETSPFSRIQTYQLCTVDNVKRKVDTVGRWTDEEIEDIITDIDDLIYIECGTPLAAALTQIGKIDSTLQYKYYVGEENIFRVDDVYYGTTTKTQLVKETQFKTNNTFGMIKIITYASRAITPDIDSELEIRYVPKIFHKLSLFRVCKALLDQIDMTSGGTISKELDVITTRLDEIETIIAHRYGVQLSSDVKYYNDTYGVNKKNVVQNFYRNNYIGSTGWDS